MQMSSTGDSAPAPASGAAEGTVTRPSPYSVDVTVGRIEGAMRSRVLTLFALVDHSGEAARVGLTLRPTKLLIFGSPTAGTPLRVASPLLARDLPLKALVWHDDAGRMFVSYNSYPWAWPASKEENVLGGGQRRRATDRRARSKSRSTVCSGCRAAPAVFAPQLPDALLPNIAGIEAVLEHAMVAASAT